MARMKKFSIYALPECIMSNNTKRKAQQEHAERRFSERTNLPLEPQTMLEIRGLIKRGKSTFIRRQSNRVTLHQVEYRHETLVVVYDKLRNQVVTVWKP